MAVGAALAVAVLGFLGSLTGSVERFVSDVGGVADLEVQAASDDGFDEELFFRIEETEGVRAAVPMMSSLAVIQGKQALFLGLDQRAEALRTPIAEGQKQRLTSRSGRVQGAPGIFLGLPLARELGVGEGDSIQVSSRGGERRLKVLGTVGGEAGRLNEGRFAVTSIPLAQQLFGKIARLDSVLVLIDRGASVAAVERELTELVTNTAIVDVPARRVTQARRATQSMRIGMQLGVGVGFVVAGFVIFNTMSVVAGERRRELATARALGGSRRRLLGLFLLEGGVLALAAAPLGSALGLVVSRRLVEAIPAGVASQVGVEVGFHLPAYALPVALVGSVGVALLATLPAAIRAAMVSPVDAIRPEGVTESLDHVEGVARLPTGAGLALTLILFVLAAVAPPVIGVAAVWGMFVSIILITYGLSHPIARLSGVFASRLGAAGRLSAAAVERSPRRAWVATAAVTAATAAVVAQAGIFDNMTGWMRTSLGSLEKGDLYVSADHPARPSPGRMLPQSWHDELAAIPGVSHVGVHTSSSITYENRRVQLSGVEASIGAEPAMAGISPAARREVESGGGAVISTSFSKLSGVAWGEMFDLETPSGTVPLEVVGVVPSLAPDGLQVTLGRDLLVERFGRPGVSDYLLVFDRGADPAQVRAAVERFLATAGIPANLLTGLEYASVGYSLLRQVRSLFSAMTWVIVGAAALAILNALLISVIERRRELGILRALGTGRGQLAATIGIEAASLGLVGGLIGCAVGFFMHRTAMGPVLAPIAEQSGLGVAYEFVPGPAGFAVLLGIAISVVGSLLPARRAAAVNIIEAIGYE